MLVSGATALRYDQEAASYGCVCSDRRSIRVGGDWLNTAVSGPRFTLSVLQWERKHQCCVRCPLLLVIRSRIRFKLVKVKRTKMENNCHTKETEFLQSGLYKWAGDAYAFDKDGPYLRWALVKDKVVARKMTKFIEGLLTKRWEKLRDVVKNSQIFSLPKYPQKWCSFTGKYTESRPGFAWLKCKADIDFEILLRSHKILTRGGERFGVGRQYVRISLLSQRRSI
ncbi:hypothetical protein GH714_023855 [Hevea brasiliensis]|uniref:Alliinase C-terminal domain-containing protein n=1 Tax=Hevea brasiliensis TaxID=3981 RepID=A0A6A6KGQ2_HEVBR|nr:hypothetical protein GH714_023855 [Hevea brasiliensis]